MTITMTSRLVTFADYDNGARIVVIEQAPKEKQLVFYHTEQREQIMFELPIPWTYFLVTGVPRTTPKNVAKRVARGTSYSYYEPATLAPAESAGQDNSEYVYNFSRVLVRGEGIESFDSKLYEPPYLNMSTSGYPCIQNSIEISGDGPTMSHLTTQAWWTTPFNAHYPPAISSRPSPFMQNATKGLLDSQGRANAEAKKMVKAMFGKDYSPMDYACLAFLISWQNATLDDVLGDNVVYGRGTSLQDHIKTLTMGRKQVVHTAK